MAASTVSRAYNQPHTISDATIARIHAAAERLGYVPNIHARALSTGRTGTVALIVPDLTNPFFPPMVRAAQQQAELNDTTVIVAETNSQPARERAQIASLAPQCEGLILASSRLPDSELRELSSRARIVLVNRDVEQVDRVLLTAGDAIHAAASQLLRTGVTRVHYLAGPHGSWSDLERATALGDALTRAGQRLETSRVETGTYQEARRRAAGIDPHVDAVVAFDDVIACGALDGLADSGRQIPEAVRLLGCDDTLPIQTRPRISTIRLPVAEGGATAVRLLAQETHQPPMRVNLPGLLCIRET